MDDLVEWLRAQLDEDERAAGRADGGPWQSKNLGRHDQAALSTGTPGGLIQLDGDRAAANGAHISRHDPGRVLREIDAKRQLLDEHQDVNDGSCGTCVNGQWGYPTHGGSSPQPHPCRTLRLLALPYGDRSGYREEWRP